MRLRSSPFLIPGQLSMIEAWCDSWVGTQRWLIFLVAAQGERFGDILRLMLHPLKRLVSNMTDWLLPVKVLRWPGLRN